MHDFQNDGRDLLLGLDQRVGEDLPRSVSVERLKAATDATVLERRKGDRVRADLGGAELVEVVAECSQLGSAYLRAAGLRSVGRPVHFSFAGQSFQKR